ncbi:MAG: glycosyltransferase family 87 protein [Verrucomicrobiota bacterium]
MKHPALSEIRTQWQSLLLLALIAWFLLASAYHSALAPSPGVTGIDFQIYYEASNRLARGEPLYINHPEGSTYVYSPALALLLRPLARLDYPYALRVWFFISALCLGGGVALYALSARFTWRDLNLAGIILIIGCRFWPTTMNFSLGQVNFLILLLLCGVFLADSLERPKTAALLIASAALLKTWMLGLLVYLILRRKWREAALGACLYALLLAACFTATGWRELPRFFQITGGYAHQNTGQFAGMQSISGFAYLHFQKNPLVDPIAANPLLFYGFIGGGFVLILAGCALIWKRTPPRSLYEARLQLGFVMLSLLLVLPMCQSEYSLFCLPLLWTLIAPPPERPRSPLVIAGSFLVYLLFTRGWPGTRSIPEIYRHGAASLVVSANFCAAFALWLIALLALHTLRRAAVQMAPAASSPVSVT